jgi:hypothetical protein
MNTGQEGQRELLVEMDPWAAVENYHHPGLTTALNPHLPQKQCFIEKFIPVISSDLLNHSNRCRYSH